MQKGEFIGRDALLRQREEGVKRMYVQLLLQDHDSDLELWAWGGEPIYRDNKYVGSTTTTGYGFTLRRMVRTLQTMLFYLIIEKTIYIGLTNFLNSQVYLIYLL